MDTPCTHSLFVHFSLDRASGPMHPLREALLWLRLADGRLMAARLPAGASLTTALAGELAAAVFGDPKGESIDVEMTCGGKAVLLYAAPVMPPGGRVETLSSMPVFASADTHALAAWSVMLDGEILALLRALNGLRTFDSIRNYNRLIALEPVIRRNRMQAITRYPAILSHVFLTPHHGHDLSGGSRHRWRLHDEEVVAAVDAGGSIEPLLARRHAVTRGVIRTPVMRSNWPGMDLARPQVMHVLDGVPAHRRPGTIEELAQARAVFQWLARESIQTPDTLRAIGAEFFREGISLAMERARKVYEDLDGALADTRDFIEDENLLLDEWLRTHGLWNLLASSRRWHAAIATRAPERLRPHAPWPVVIGRCRLGEWEAEELDSPMALAHEGGVMHHCVATRWADCVERGSRIFSLKRGSERATAQYDLRIDRSRYAVFVLAELRGPCNQRVSAQGARAARQLLMALNAPQREEAIARVVASRRPVDAEVESCREKTHGLDPRSIERVRAPHFLRAENHAA